MDENELTQLIKTVIRELSSNNLITPTHQKLSLNTDNQQGKTEGDIQINLNDPTLESNRKKPGNFNPRFAESLPAIIGSTSARIGVGRAGPRYTTSSWLLFQADHAITQDALYMNVESELLSRFGLFTVDSQVTGGKSEYLLRPDLGRKLSDEAKRVISNKCIHNPILQVCVGDGLSSKAININLSKILPVIQQGAESAGLELGTPFYINHCRVGILNDIGEILHPEVLVLLIGERPGLGRAESMSAYMAFRPKEGDTDAERDVICNIFDNGGTNPLEAGAYIIQMVKRMMQHQASGVALKIQSE